MAWMGRRGVIQKKGVASLLERKANAEEEDGVLLLRETGVFSATVVEVCILQGMYFSFRCLVILATSYDNTINEIKKSDEMKSKRALLGDFGMYN